MIEKKVSSVPPGSVQAVGRKELRMALYADDGELYRFVFKLEDAAALIEQMRLAGKLPDWTRIIIELFECQIDGLRRALSDDDVPLDRPLRISWAAASTATIRSQAFLSISGDTLTEGEKTMLTLMVNGFANALIGDPGD